MCNQSCYQTRYSFWWWYCFVKCSTTDIETSDKSYEEDTTKKLLRRLLRPYYSNAGITEQYEMPSVTEGYGINVVTGNMVNMIESGIIDPLLVTKSALNNAASVATTILSTDCVINNLKN